MLEGMNKFEDHLENFDVHNEVSNHPNTVFRIDKLIGPMTFIHFVIERGAPLQDSSTTL